MKPFATHITLLLLLGCSLNSSAQDAIQSQFWNMPAMINPAHTGLIEENYRASSTYRNQWTSLTTPFTTLQAAFDTRLGQNRTSGFLGVGGFVRQHKGSKGSMRTFEASGEAAVHLRTGESSLLSFGLSAGYRQRSIAFDGLSWDAQYNGIAYDPGIDPGENFSNDQASTIDLAFGMNYRQSGNVHFDAGYALWHYFQGQGFLFGDQDRLILRHQINFHWLEKYNGIEVHYDAIAAVQGGAQTIVGGARAYYRMGNDSKYTNAMTSDAIIGGLHYRWADAVIFTVGYEYKRSLNLTFSYDLTTSSLRSQNQMRGAWEVGLRWQAWYPGNRVNLR